MEGFWKAFPDIFCVFEQQIRLCKVQNVFMQCIKGLFKSNNRTEMSNTKQAKCIVVGAGQRGFTYSEYAVHYPDKLKVVAIADPLNNARVRFQKRQNIPDKMVFSDWKDIAKEEKFADFVCICTPDRLHKEVALGFIKKGYHVLLEKPMATKEEDCKEICEACREYNVMLCVCHVLRYYPPNLKIKELIDNGTIGDVVTIQHLEPIGYYHFAHSYVRGNWRNTEESSFSLLAKSCHDIDLINSWIPEKCKSVSSFGSLNHFKPENRPTGASTRCLSCHVEETCPYSAVKIYLNPAKRGNFGWPTSVVTDVEDLDILVQKLKTGPYGRCVYDCDNDVCDNQVVNLEFENGKTASFTMVAFTESICARKTRVFGTKGELTYDGGSQVSHFDFLTRKKQVYTCTSASTIMRGHGGADFCLMENFMQAIATNNPSLIKSDIDQTLQSHQLVFAAERSRLLGKTLRRATDGSWI